MARPIPGPEGDELAMLHELSGYLCLVLADDDPAIRTVRDATDLVGQALSDGATVIAIPSSHLDDAFFQLRSGLAGEILQKAANYGIKFAVIGDISAHLAASTAFHDLVMESHHSRDYFFLPDIDALSTRLAKLAASP